MNAVLEKATEDTVYRISATLIAVQHAVAEIAGGKPLDVDPRALVDAVRQVRSVLKSIEDAYGVFIGGLAVQQHGYERYTKDVDVVVDSAHFGAVLQKLRDGGFVVQPDFGLTHRDTGAQLDLLREGTTLKNSPAPLPHPSELGVSGGFATLPALIQLKLNASRLQDKADIVELLKRQFNRAPEIAAQLPPQWQAEFAALTAQAAREME